MAAPDDPFDIDEIQFSSDDDSLQKIAPVERNAGTLLAAFKSQRALNKSNDPPSTSPLKPSDDFDNDSVVEFNYEDETFDEDEETPNQPNLSPDMNAEPSHSEQPSERNYGLASNGVAPQIEESSGRPARRMKSIFDTISQLRSRSNSSAKLLSANTSPTRNLSESDTEEKNASISSRNAPYSVEGVDFTRSLDSISSVDPKQVHLSSLDLNQKPADLSPETGASDQGRSVQSDLDGRPAITSDRPTNSGRSVSTWETMAKPQESAINWAINESTPRLGPIPVPDRNRDIPVLTKPTHSDDLQTYFQQNHSTEIAQTFTALSSSTNSQGLLETGSTRSATITNEPFMHQGRSNISDNKDLVSEDQLNKAESVSPSHSAATLCDSNADLDPSPTVNKSMGKNENEPLSCPSPTRRKSKALRHIKRKVDIGKRRQREDRSDRTDKRVEQVQIEREERLKELERDKFLLESQLNQLSVSVSGSFRERLHAGAPLPSSVNDSQLEDIKKEMQSMEKIIEALNEENAKLYSSLRGEQISMKGTAQQMLERNKNLRSELDLAKAEIQELRASKLTTANEGAQEEIRRLKHSMVQQRNDFESKLRAAQAQIDSLRRKNEELEYRVQTVNYEPTSPRRQRPGTPVKSKVAVEKYEREIADLREKLQWYIENQKLIDDLQSAIKQKDDSIRTLQHRVDLLYAETKSSKKKPSVETASNHDNKRIRELELEIAQLKKQQPHKRAVNAMVKAANRPDPRLVQQLQKINAELQEELAAKDADYMVRMRNLRLECDKMRIQYDERVSQLLADKREHARPHERIRELEEQIEEMRETYRRKGKRDTVSLWTQTDFACDHGDREELESNDYDRENDSSKFWHRIKMAEDQNRRDQDRIHELETELAKKAVRSENDFDSVIAALNEAHASQIDALQAEIRRLTESLRKNPDTILDRTATSHLVASLQSQLDVSHRENLALKESLIETQFELSRLRSMPTHVQIGALELKLNEIESRHASRETSLREALHNLELQSESRSHQSVAKYEAMVREKNAQINEFRAELDILLAELSRLQQRYQLTARSQ